MIQDVDQDDTNLYLRVIAKGDQYSFYSNSVSITLLCKKSSNTLKLFGERQWNDTLIIIFLDGTHAPSNASDTITGKSNVYFAHTDLKSVQRLYRQQFQYFPLEGATPMTPLHTTIVVTVIALLILFIGAVLVIKQKW